jgi:hypothetical protein
MLNRRLLLTFASAALAAAACSSGHATPPPAPGPPTFAPSIWQTPRARPHPAWTRPLQPGGPAVTCYYVLNDGGKPGRSYQMDAPGPGRQIEATVNHDCYVFIREGLWAGRGTTYLMRANGGGDCAAYVPSMSMGVYEQPCDPADTGQLWWPDGSLLISQGATAAGCGGIGGLCGALAYYGITDGSPVIAETVPAGPDSDWTTPAS